MQLFFLFSSDFQSTNKKGETEELVKVRGFCLRNAAAISKINYSVMRDMIQQWATTDEVKSVEVDNFSMRISRKDFSVHNAVLTKTYTNDGFNKRYLNKEDCGSCLKTYPYGATGPNFVDNPPA